MNILLDTHVFLWAVTQRKLSTNATSAFYDLSNQFYLSAASYWEISIKVSIGKLTLAPNWGSLFDQFMATNQIQWLPIEIKHCQFLSTMPFHHNDPFDRLLIAQAITENMYLMSADSNFSAYPVALLW